MLHVSSNQIDAEEAWRLKFKEVQEGDRETNLSIIKNFQRLQVLPGLLFLL